MPVAAKADYQKRVAATRASAAWMRGTGYGVMLQYGGWGYPLHGPKKPWSDVVNAFDTEKFARMVDEDMGARWVIWSITLHAADHFPTGESLITRTVFATTPSGRATTSVSPSRVTGSILPSSSSCA